MQEVVYRFPGLATFYVVVPLIVAPFGYVLGVSFLHLDPRLVVPTLGIMMLVALISLGQGLFTSATLGEDYVRLHSPFREVLIRSVDVHHQSLWRRTPQEAFLPYWKQAAVLTV